MLNSHDIFEGVGGKAMKNFAKVMSVSLIIAILFALGGCGALTKKIADEAKTKISEQLDTTKGNNKDSEDTQAQDDTNDTTQSKGNSDSDSGDSTKITTSDSKSMNWPTKSMGNITPVTCKVVAVWTETNGATVSFEGMQRAEADKYISDFESNGYTNGYETEDGSGLLFVKTDSNGNTITFGYSPDGTGTISYTPAAKS